MRNCGGAECAASPQHQRKRIMTNQKPDQEKQATPKGAVEVDEEKLDHATGGISLNYSKIELDYAQKVAPSDPTISEATFTEKRI
jgi:hypothetical protein